MQRGKIKSVEFIPVELRSTNWDQSTAVVKITDENGICGIGECDGPVNVMREIFKMETAHGWSKNPVEMLIGKDPLEIQAIWQDLYNGLLWQGRRGLMMYAIAGIDMALYDLCGKQIDVPAYKLLGGAVREHAQPYATLYPEVSGKGSLSELLQEYEELFEKAKKLGLKAVKMAILPGEEVTDKEYVAFIKSARKSLGYDLDLMIDFLYRWKDPYDVIHVLKKLEEEDLYFAEAVLPHDDLLSHKTVADHTDIRICGAEMATSYYEIVEWVEKSKVAIVQPDINRCGGLTEIMRIAKYCDAHGIQVMPHGWKTGITAAAGTHFHMAVSNAKYFEYLDPSLYNSPMRKYLVDTDMKIENGIIEKPQASGLGITLNEEFVNNLEREDDNK